MVTKYYKSNRILFSDIFLFLLDKDVITKKRKSINDNIAKCFVVITIYKHNFDRKLFLKRLL